MILIEQQAEHKLFKVLEDQAYKNKSWLCLHLNAPGYDLDPQMVISRLNFETRNLNSAEHLKIYAFEDGNVFIYTDHIPRKELLRLCLPLLQEHPDLKDNQSFMTVYDSEGNGRKLLSLCKRYRDEMEKKLVLEQEMQQREQREKERLKVLNHNISQTYIQSISSRRLHHEGKKILVVEDDPLTQKLINNVLAPVADVVSAKNGAQALQYYADCAPDVLFLDIELPDVNGLDVLKAVKAMDQDAYVIMLSGNGSKESILHSMQQGAKGFVGKPFTKDRLMHYIEKSPHILTRKEKGESHGALVSQS